MKTLCKAFGRIESGRLVVPDRDELARKTKVFPDQDVDIIIRKHVKCRSLDQNAYFWVLVNLISNESGDDANSVYFNLLRMYLDTGNFPDDLYRKMNNKGKEYMVVASSTKFPKDVFTVLIQITMDLADFLGIKYMTPDEYRMQYQ